MYLVGKAGVLGSAAGEAGGNRQIEWGNAVEPGDEKPGQRRWTGKEKGIPRENVFLFK